MVQLQTVLKVLGDETRFKIINLLLSQDYCVTALAKQLGLSEAAISQHLRVMRQAGLVRGEKKGYWTHYYVQTEAITEAADKLRDIILNPVGVEGACHNSHICCRKGGKKDV